MLISISIGIAIAVIFVICGVVIPQIVDQSEDTMTLDANSTWKQIQDNMSSNVFLWVIIIALLALVIMSVAGMMVYRGRGEGGI